MQTRRTLLRGASVLALAAVIIGGSLIASPATPAAAAPIQRINGNDNNSGGGIADVPIIGDVVSQFENAEPEEIATGAIQFTAAAAETVVPIVIRLFK